MAVAGRPPYRDKGMSNDLYSRINAIDLKHPYVWKLRISSAEFDDLEGAVRAETTTALQNVIYLAEWYKRCYDGGSAKPVKEFDCQKLFDEAGIDKEKNLIWVNGFVDVLELVHELLIDLETTSGIKDKDVISFIGGFLDGFLGHLDWVDISAHVEEVDSNLFGNSA